MTKNRKDYMRSGEGEFTIYNKDGEVLTPKDIEDEREKKIQKIMKYAQEEIDRQN